MLKDAHIAFVKTTACRFMLVLIVLFASLSFAGCGTGQKADPEAEAEAIARTEFTNRIENFFEYEPLKAGQPSQFLIHLTDLTDGTPVEKADVTLVARSRGGAEVAQTKARVGTVTGIYVADVNLPNTGEYDIEFRVKNEKIDERLSLSDFKVE